MKHLFFYLICLLALPATVLADGNALQYWILERNVLLKLAPDESAFSKLTPSHLKEVAVASGIVRGQGSVHHQEGDLVFEMDFYQTDPRTGSREWSFRAVSRNLKSGKTIFAVEATAPDAATTALRVSPGWRQPPASERERGVVILQQTSPAH